MYDSIPLYHPVLSNERCTDAKKDADDKGDYLMLVLFFTSNKRMSKTHLSRSATPG
ncbi:hypothetical protein BDR03DRAFT_964581 [Suillus americanus]|nr:hypothetical protein BDR03DRAFT_964581 [Suillus americanus]